jgi:hypothetical protein
MGLTYTEVEERPTGEGTCSISARDLDGAYYDAFLNLAEEVSPETWKKRFLKTDHKASIHVKTGSIPASVVIEKMTQYLFEREYDRIDSETFGPFEFVVTVTEPVLNLKKEQSCS